MIITVVIRRTTAQLIAARVSAWTVDRGSWELARVEWDPSGPLSARQAAMDGLFALWQELGGDERELFASLELRPV